MLHQDRHMPLQSDVTLRLRPWRLDADEDVEVAENLAAFDIDLLVYSKQDQSGGVVVVGVVVWVRSTVGGGAEDQMIDVLADFRRQGEEVRFC